MTPWRNRRSRRRRRRPRKVPLRLRPRNKFASRTKKSRRETGGFLFCFWSHGRTEKWFPLFLADAPLRSFKLKRHAIHAIAEARRLGSIVEDMSQMPAAAMTMHFGADHHLAGVPLRQHRALQRLPEAWPASLAVIFR